MITRGGFLSGSAAALVAAGETPASSVATAYQPGLGYASVIVMDKLGHLAKQFPSTQLSWHELSNGDAIRDGIISNTIQFGAVGTAPFLIGWDRGVPWKILCDCNNFDFWLVVMDPNIKSIKDLKPGDKIASPSPDAINTMVLRSALARAGLPNDYLNVGVVAMPHPLAEQALLNRQIVGHIATPPFAQDEVKRGGHVILRTGDGFPGGITSTVVVATTPFAQQYPNFVGAYFKEYVSAVKLIQSHPDDAAKMYVEATAGKANLDDVQALLHDLSSSLFTVAPHGVMQVAAFLVKVGLIKKAPASFAEISLGYVNETT
jgi:NitT/TauT family transport system substrate-binding protein